MVHFDTSSALKILGEGEVLQCSTRWSKRLLVWPNLLAAPIYIFGLLLLIDTSTRIPALVLLGIALLISLLAYAAWKKRLVIVTNQRVIYLAGLTAAVRATPLDKIEKITRTPGKLVIRASGFNTMRLSVSEPVALAWAIEMARAEVISRPQKDDGEMAPPQDKSGRPTHGQRPDTQPHAGQIR